MIPIARNLFYFCKILFIIIPVNKKEFIKIERGN